MRSTRNWGMIRSGETFEALATTIVFFEEPTARLLGRRGKDGGQDARSGDGKTVYQAKHHEKPTATKAIADAKSEAATIKKYRQPGHSRHAQWAEVTNWVLVTNASFNPTDDQEWTSEVVPLFAKLGVVASYWEEETLNGYLDKHPEVDRAFFQNENRVFLSPPEACLVVADADPFTRLEHPAPYVGRQSDFSALKAFLTTDKRVLQVHAAGGIGKTRFLLEAACDIAGEGDWQVLWANTQTMESSSTWFEAIVPERPTFLIVDEPDDERLIQRLSEQIGPRVGRTQAWKIAIAVRSAKDPIVRALQHPRQKRWVTELLLAPLSLQDCEQMCLGLMGAGKIASATSATWRLETAKTLARRFDGFPIWLTLAVHLLEEDGSLAELPATSRELCSLYIEEALDNTDRKALDVLQWIALLGQINREDKDELQRMKAQLGFAKLSDLEGLLKQLVGKRLLRKWGARDRLVDVKPDVLRDFLLQKWLCEEHDYGEHRTVPSESATQLAEQLSQALIEGTVGKREERLVASLARTDFLLRYGNLPVNLTAPLFAAINSSLPLMTPSRRISVIENLKNVGAYFPGEMLQLLRRLRLEPASEEIVEGYWSTRTYNQDDVALVLARAYQGLAHALLTDEQSAFMFGELFALAVEERRIASGGYSMPNDGNRAEGVIRNLLENGPYYSREFGDVAAQVVLRELEPSEGSRLDTRELEALGAIVKPLCVVYRHQSWFEGMHVHLRRQLLSPDHCNIVGRQQVLARLRSILAQEADRLPDEVRVELWRMVSDAHQQANFAKGHVVGENDPFLAKLNTELTVDLVWAKTALTHRTPSPRELRSARKLWQWHAEHDADEDLKLLAQELEAIYLAHPSIQRFEFLANWTHREETLRQIESQATALAVAGAAEIKAYFSEALSVLADKDVMGVDPVAWALGRLAPEHQPVRDFIVGGLQDEKRGAVSYEFVLSALRGWVLAQRPSDAVGTAALVNNLLSHCTAEKKLDVLRLLYGTLTHYDTALLASTNEFEIVRDAKPLFAAAGAVPDFVKCTLWGLHHDWVGLKAELDELLANATAKQRRDAMLVAVEVLQRVLEDAGNQAPPADLLKWVWDQLTLTPELSWLRHERSWYVEQVTAKLGKAPLTWVLDTILRRADLHDASDGEHFDAPSELLPMVQLIDLDNAVHPDAQEAVAALVQLVDASPILSYWLPKFVTRIDPHGIEVPRLLAATIDGSGDSRKATKLARAACFYGVGSPAWRQIARAAFTTTKHSSQDERELVYHAVSETGRRSSISSAGEVPSIYTDAVDVARKGFTEETEQDFILFWQWRLKGTEAELRDQKERLKEETWT